MNTTLTLSPPRSTARDALLTGALVFFAVVVVFRAMGLSLLQSDVLDYVEQSQHWWQRNMHLPGYAILIWAARQITHDRFDPALLMQIVCLLCWSASVIYTARTLAIVSENENRWGTALYALFPFVGITYAAWPIADSLALAVLAAAFYYLLQRQWWPLTASLAAALLVQKALWPFAFLIGIVAVWRRGFPIWQLLLAGVPLVAWWLWGVLTGGEWLWIIRIDLKVNLPSHSHLPVLDGVLGTLLAGGVRGLVKGGLLLALLAGTLWLTGVGVRRRRLDMLAMVLPILALLLLLNQWEAWAAVRYAKVLVVPLIALLPANRLLTALNQRPWAFWIFVGLLAASQVLYAVYMNAYFAAPAA